MQRKHPASARKQHPAHCPSCEREFVTATELVDFIDEGLFMIRLHCNNCGHERVAEMEDAQLELLEQAHLEAQAMMIEDLAVLHHSAAGDAA
jgi:C4-type Zn-finger protein